MSTHDMPNVRIEPTDKAQEAIDAWHKECQARWFAAPERPKLTITKIEPSMWHEEGYDFIIHVDLTNE